MKLLTGVAVSDGTATANVCSVDCLLLKARSELKLLDSLQFSDVNWS